MEQSGNLIGDTYNDTTDEELHAAVHPPLRSLLQAARGAGVPLGWNGFYISIDGRAHARVPE
jgi:hypothetical protein